MFKTPSFIFSMSSAWGKRMSSAWGKRMSSAWGKRAGIDSDDYYNHLLREPYYQARFYKYDYPRYPIDNERKIDEKTNTFSFTFFLFRFIFY